MMAAAARRGGLDALRWGYWNALKVPLKGCRYRASVNATAKAG